MLFVFFMLDEPDAAERRRELRSAHRAYLAEVRDRIFAAGPLMDDAFSAPVGSLLIMDWPERGAALDWLAREPFTRHGVYEEKTVMGYLNLWPKGERPAIRNRLFAFLNLNGPHAAELRQRHREAHLAYLRRTEEHIFAAGPLMDEGWTGDAPAFEHRAGTLYIVDFPDRRAAGVWLGDEPYAAAGVYGSMSGRGYDNLWPRSPA